MKSLISKRSVVVAGHKTSVSLEDAFWKGLKEVAGERDATLSELVGTIDSEREYGNLSSALRLFVLDFYRTQLSDLKEGRDGSDGESESSGAVRIRRIAQARLVALTAAQLYLTPHVAAYPAGRLHRAFFLTTSEV
jgi:predicted DNA-binding ribbon-helix-helix protein